MNATANFETTDARALIASRNEFGDYAILDAASGSPVTRFSIDLPEVFPVGSGQSAWYCHPFGIRLYAHDARQLGFAV